jgi:PAS domain S-box-containing protein
MSYLLDTKPRSTSTPAELESILSKMGQTSPAAPTETTGSANSLEVKLHRAEARYRMLIEQIPAVTFLAGLDNKGNEMYVSPQIENLLGFTQREWLENPVLWYTQLHVEDRQRWHIEFAHTCATAEPFCAEYRFIAKNGKIVWIRGEAKFIKDDQGRLLYLQGVAFDITAIKQAELELRTLADTLTRRVAERTASLEQASHQLTLSNTHLRDGETRLRAILDTAAEGIVTINADGLIEGFNRASEQIFQYEAPEVLGKNVSMLMPPAYAREHDQFIGAYLSTGVKKIIGIGREVTGLRKDGTIFPMELAVSEVRLESRRMFTGVVRDITERKRIETALLEAKEQAESANRAKSDFLSRTSHELRTPLNAILGFAQVMELGSPTPRQQRQLEQIIKGGRHLLNLINEVLDIARIEAGRVDLSLEPVRIGPLVQEVVDLTQSLAESANVQLCVNLAEFEARFVRADKQRLRQILLNLISNGIKYNSPQGRLIVACEETPDNRLRITIDDTGAGIPADKVSRLFTPFDRLGAETSNIEGTGLGLALSFQLAQAMGGLLGCSSIVGEGSKFFIEMPETQRSHQLEGAVGTSKSLSEYPAKKLFVLLYIEDNIDNISLVEEILVSRPQVRLLTATHGEEGLKIARQQMPALILLDVHLPDLKGDEFLRRLQAMPEARDIPVIALSADATVNQIARLRAAGAREYLTKPVDVPQFLNALDQVFAEGST